jgi:hypothetical protein
VPDAWREVDASEFSAGAQVVAVGDESFVVEYQEVGFAFKHQERFGFRGIEMTVRTDIGSLEKNVEEAVRIVVRPGVEVVIHPPAWGLGSLSGDLVEERL